MSKLFKIDEEILFLFVALMIVNTIVDVFSNDFEFSFGYALSKAVAFILIVVSFSFIKNMWNARKGKNK